MGAGRAVERQTGESEYTTVALLNITIMYVCVCVCVCVCGWGGGGGGGGGGGIPVTVMVSTKLLPGVVLVVIY